MSSRVRRWNSTIVRDSDSIDAATRTLNVEVDINNPQGPVKTGAYALLHLETPAVCAGLRQFAPPFRQTRCCLSRRRIAHQQWCGMVRRRVDSHRIERIFGATVEVVAGLQPSR